MAAPRVLTSRPFWVFTGLTLGALVFVWISLSGRSRGAVSALEAFGHTLATPFRMVAVAISGGLSRSADVERDRNALATELARARRELVAYQMVHDELKTLRRDHENLERLLGLGRKMPWNHVAARVAFKDPQNLFVTLTLDAGKNQGIREGDPVVGFTDGVMGLVGKVSEAESSTCKVLTLIDPRCQVGIMLEDTGDAGLLRGQAPANLSCAVEYLDRRLDRLENRVVITSGIGGTYPKGVYVGRITEVVRKRFGLFQETWVHPHINFFTLSEVFVLVKDDAAGRNP